MTVPLSTHSLRMAATYGLDDEIDRLRTAGLSFRSDVVAGPGGRQILIADPAGNLSSG